MLQEQSVCGQRISESHLLGTNCSFPIKYQKWEMMDGLIEPLHIIYSGIEDHSQLFFFSKCVSAQGLFLILSSSLSYLKCHYFPVALRGTHDRCLTRQRRRGALLPAVHHRSPLHPLHPCLSGIEELVWFLNKTAELSPVMPYYPTRL